MNTRLNTAASLMALALAAGPVLAQDAAGAKTREQVRAELIEAQQRGEIMVDGESGRMLNELAPQRYRSSMMAEGKTRAEVRAESLEARRTGDSLAGSDHDSAFTQPVSAMAAGPGRTRAEVKAELMEAQRRGETLMNGDSWSSFDGGYPYRPRGRGRSE
ncbi:MAG: DUF4148 domain-containing protein [Polaromonas sp.]|nr:DUF4148 domain-containing protein [Polaromonas sp.]